VGNEKIMKNWNTEINNSIIHRVEGKIHHGPPLKERISEAVYRLRMQSQKLEEATLKMQNHDRELFQKCVSAEMAKDSGRATIYANECVEVRKMAKLILLSQLALEQVALRLETIQEFGDVMTQIAPATKVIHSLKGNLAGIIPEVSYELGSVDDMLNGLIVDAGNSTASSVTVGVSGNESQKILGEAGMMAEQKMKDRFPDIPHSQRVMVEEEKLH
jgi:division protein CdvB (Snf7/Vps24/ESCRT-III family)